jgi:circadian clock protein KaiB
VTVPRTLVRLYVAGDAPNSVAAIANLKALLAACEDSVDLEIIDVLVTPDLATSHGVLLTPMLVKVSPPPERRVLGILSKLDVVVAALALRKKAGK